MIWLRLRVPMTQWARENQRLGTGMRQKSPLGHGHGQDHPRAGEGLDEEIGCIAINRVVNVGPQYRVCVTLCYTVLHCVLIHTKCT